jgi:hypothetical protein
MQCDRINFADEKNEETWLRKSWSIQKIFYRKKVCTKFLQKQDFFTTRRMGSSFSTLIQQLQENRLFAESHSIPALILFFSYIPIDEFNLEFLINLTIHIRHFCVSFMDRPAILDRPEPRVVPFDMSLLEHSSLQILKFQIWLLHNVSFRFNCTVFNTVSSVALIFR